MFLDSKYFQKNKMGGFKMKSQNYFDPIAQWLFGVPVNLGASGANILPLNRPLLRCNNAHHHIEYHH